MSCPGRSWKVVQAAGQGASMRQSTRLRPGARRPGFEPQLHRLRLDAWEASGGLSVVACEAEAVKSGCQGCFDQLDKCLAQAFVCKKYCMPGRLLLCLVLWRMSEAWCLQTLRRQSLQGGPVLGATGKQSSSSPSTQDLLHGSAPPQTPGGRPASEGGQAPHCSLRD